MYNLLHKAINLAGVPEKSSEPEWQNEYSQKLSCESEATGENIEYKILHPNYILHVDEIGNNTYRRDNGRMYG